MDLVKPHSPEHPVTIDQNGYEHRDARDSNYAGMPQGRATLISLNPVFSDAFIKRMETSYSSAQTLEQGVSWKDVRDNLQKSQESLAEAYDARKTFIGWKYTTPRGPGAFARLGLLDGDILFGINGSHVGFKNTHGGLVGFPRDFFTLKTQEIYLLRGDQFVRIHLVSKDGPDQTPPTAGTQKTLHLDDSSLSRADQETLKLNSHLTEARAVPYFENGKLKGYRLFQVENGGFYDKLGLKNGDIIVKWNGRPFLEPGQTFRMTPEMKSGDEILILRDGKSMHIKSHLPEKANQ